MTRPDGEAWIFTVDVDIAHKRGRFTVKTPSYECDGGLNLLTHIGRTYGFDEHLSSGDHPCLQHSYLELTIDASHIHLAVWNAANDQLIGRADLRRGS